MKYSPQKGLTFAPTQMPASILIHGDHSFNQAAKLDEIFEKNPSLKKEQKRFVSESALLSGEVFLDDLLSSTDMFAGPQHIIVQDVTDKMHKFCENLDPEKTPLFFLLSHNYLTPQSKLRQLYEEHTHFLCIPCYALTPQELLHIVTQFFKKHDKVIQTQLAHDLATFLADSPHTIQVELEKILTISGTEPEVTYDHIKGTLVSSKLPEARDLIDAFLNKNQKKFSLLLKSQDSATYISTLRMLTGSLLKLHQIKSYMEDGESFEASLKNIRPPVFFKERNIVKSQVQHWSIQNIEETVETLRTLEVNLKKTAVGANEVFAVTLMQTQKN